MPMTEAIAALRFDPSLPAWLLAVLAIVCTIAAGLGFWRRARGAWLRAAGFAVVLLWLAGPMLVRETRQGLANIALLVVDRSASMQVGDRAALAERARQFVQTQAARLPGLELRTVEVPPTGHDGTPLWAAVRQALAEIPPARLAGVIAVTDGMAHDLPASMPPDWDAAPLHALIAARGEEWDRRVRVIEAPSYGIVGHTLDLRVSVEDVGHGAPEPGGLATLTIQRDGDAPQTRQVTVGEVQTVPVDITRAGTTLIRLATDPQPGEASALNDQAVVQIRGVRDRLRVLLVSGEPNQGERIWRRLLKSDPAVDLVHFTILRPPEKDDTTPLNELALIAFPTRELFQDKLAGFDLIILDRFTDRGILPHLYLRNIADYVRRGGALLLVAGPEFATPASLDQTPLASVLPAHAPLSAEGVVDGAFRPAVTPLGTRHPVTQGLTGANDPSHGGEASWGPWYRAIDAEDVQGQVLMTGPDARPLLILNHVDQGRAALLMSDQSWLWSRGHMGGGPQAELLRRVAHWLMKEPELEEERLSARIDMAPGGNAAHLDVERRSVTGATAMPVTVTPPAGPRQTLALATTSPGLATGSLGLSASAAQSGVWQVSDGTHVAFAAAGQENPAEFFDLRATAERLKPLLRESGGGTVWLGRSGPPVLRLVGADSTASGAGWIGLRTRGAHLVTGVSSVPLAPAWLALPILLGLLLAAWRREAH